MLECDGPSGMKKKTHLTYKPESERKGERQREKEREREVTFSTGLAVVCCVPATTALGPSLSPTLNPDSGMQLTSPAVSFSLLPLV